MSFTKLLALSALVALVVLGAGLVFAGIKHAQPGQVDRHVHSAVYHRSPAPARRA